VEEIELLLQGCRLWVSTAWGVAQTPSLI